MTLAETQRSQRKARIELRAKTTYCQTKISYRRGRRERRGNRKRKFPVPSSQFSVVRPFVASENRDRHLFVLGSLKSSQSLTSNVARTVGSLVRKAVRGDQKKGG